LVEILAKSFVTHITHLSTQKFSSNVIEKCLRVAQPETRNAMIRQLLVDNGLGNLLQDPFGNYVVQTALSAATEIGLYNKLVEAIRPHLNQLRNTPYGKRIQSKITKETAERQHAQKR